MADVVNMIKGYGIKKLKESILGPLDVIVGDNLTEISTTIGCFVIRNIRSKFARSITFNIGLNWYDDWMEDALYAILYQYNDIQKKSKLELVNAVSHDDDSSMYYRLGAGSHSLKYRNYDITLMIQTSGVDVIRGKSHSRRSYTLITYDLNPNFIKEFERDMLANRNALLKICKSSPTLNIYRDLHDDDETTYWEKTGKIPKRTLNTLYLPTNTKNQIISVVNNFIASKEKYQKLGVPHNLKILLHGGHGYGKDTIARVIASEYNRNIYYVTGGRQGYYIPNAITSNSPRITSPLFIISDIDKYHFLITDDYRGNDKNDEPKLKDTYKLLFGKMINALDGITSPEGRIIVMTTNHFEKFSPVFLRPGRVDLILEIKAVEPDAFRKYTYDNYQVSLPKDITLKSDKLSIADLQFDTLYLKCTADEFIKKYVK